MANTRKDHPIRGLLIPDTRICHANLENFDTFFTQEGARAGGVAVPQSELSKVVIETLGLQEEEIAINVTDGGFPGLDDGLRCSYKMEADTLAAKGWNAPNLIEGFNAFRFHQDTTESVVYSMIDAIDEGNGNVIAAFSDGTDAFLIRYIPATDTTETIYDPAVNPAPSPFNNAVAMCSTADGYILLLTKADSLGWCIYRSGTANAADSGFEPYALEFFDTYPASSAVRARLLFSKQNDEYGYFHTTATVLTQYASSSDAISFQQIDTFTTTAPMDACVTSSGRFGVLYVKASTGLLCWRSVGSVWDSIADADEVVIGGVVVFDECWVYQDPVGRLYAYGRVTGIDTVNAYYSDDEGDNWTLIIQGLYGSTSAGDASSYPTNGKIVHALGSAWWIHQGVGTSTNDRGSVNIAKLGGWSNLILRPQPGTQINKEYNRPSFGIDTASASTGSVYLPVEYLSQVTGWTTAGTSVGHETLEDDGSLQTLCTSTALNYTRTLGAGSDDRGVFMMDFAVLAGGSLTAQRSGMSILLSNPVTSQELGVFATTTTLRLRDQNAGATLVDLTIDMTQYLQIMVCWELVHTRLEVYYRRPGSARWISLYQSSTTLTTAASTTSKIVVGNVTTSSVQARYRMVGIHSDNNVATAIWATELSTDATLLRNRLVGRLVNQNPCPIYDKPAGPLGSYGLPLQTYLRGKDGPGSILDTFLSNPVYDYGVENVDCMISPSPRVKHRTVVPESGVATEVQLRYAPSAEQTSLTRSIGLAILGANYRYAYLEGSYDDSTFDTLATLDLATGLTGLAFVRTGNVLRIDTGSVTADRYIWRNELVGGHVYLAGTPDIGVYKIIKHTEGVWGLGAGKHVEIIIEDGDGGVIGSKSDPAPDDGVMDIWAPAGVVAVHDIDEMYSYYRVRIPVQTTLAGYFEHGIVMVGAVQAFGLQPSWGTNYKFDPNQESFTSRSGTSRRRALGPVIPSWNIAWTDEQDLSRLRDADPTPDFLAFSGDTEGMANFMDVPYLMSGLLEELRSGSVPVVVMGKIPDGVTITDPSLFLYGRVASSVQIENVQGDEGTDEVHRVQSITIEGIV